MAQQQELELDSVIRHPVDKRTRFHVNRVKSSEAQNGGQSVVNVSEGDTTDDDDNERSPLNAEPDNKYDKSFR